MGKPETAADPGLSGSRNVGKAISIFVAGIIALVSTGQLQVPLPSPAHNKVVHVVPDDVLPWRPQPLQGQFAPNTRLHDAVRLFEGKVLGAESVAVAPNGNLALLDRYGNLFEADRVTAAANHAADAAADPAASNDSSSSSGWVLRSKPEAWLGAGRPLGYHFDAQGNLIVCDSLKGLVKYDYSSKDITLLATHVSSSSPIDPGSEITYANDLAIASDGKIYFTSCTDIVPALNKAGYYDTFRAWMLGLAQGLPKGRLLRYDPATKETVVLAKGFYYANGVALSSDESYLILAETDRIRLLKYWLKGPQAGMLEPLITNLPGPPDGVSTSSDGNFWVGLVSPVPPIARILRDPTVRALYAWLPDALRPPLKKWGAVMKVSGTTGDVLDFLMDPTGDHISTISAAVEHDGKLFMGNLAGNYVSYIDLAASRQKQQHAAAAEAAGGGKRRQGSGFVTFADAAEFEAAADQEWELCSADGPHGSCGADLDLDHDDLDHSDHDDLDHADHGDPDLTDHDLDLDDHDDHDDAQQDLGQGKTSMSDEDKALLYIHSKVHHNKVIIFSKSYCPFCRKAKNALLKFLKPEQFHVVELDLLHELPDTDQGRSLPAAAMQDALERVTGKRTVPRVFIGGNFVGGGDDMDSMAQTGRLKSVLEEQGIITV